VIRAGSPRGAWPAAFALLRLALLCLPPLCLPAPAGALAAEPDSAAALAPGPALLVGTAPGATAASAVPGSRVAPGVRAVRGDAATARRLRRLPGVRWVEPNRRFYASSVRAPTDPLFAAQWALRSARVPAAWATATGGDVTVAVVDSGIDLSNPDLAGNLWTNARETPGNGVDDDSNGFIDDVHGADTVSHDGDPADGLGHGTAVASLIGARGDNGFGISGVAWRVRLMPVKVLHDRGWGTTLTLITGLQYALANGARVINLSLNGSEPSQALEEAIRQAEAQGALVVTSAGNDGADRDAVPSYPASIGSPAVLTVASSTRSGALGSGSAYGASVDIAAPGEGIVASDLNAGFTTQSGTSFAAAYVSGAAALLAAARPGATATQLRSALVRSARRGGSVDQWIHGGRLDVKAALKRLKRARAGRRAR
jgi:subtilisin family serine protease